MNRLLIVDDDLDVLASFKLTLKNRFEIICFSKAVEALEYLDGIKGDHQHLDAIISDQRMPEMNGADFLTKARKYEPEIPFIAYSAFTELDMLQKCVNDAGATVFISKNTRLLEVGDIVQKAIDENKQALESKTDFLRWVTQRQNIIMTARRQAVSQLFPNSHADLWLALKSCSTAVEEFETIDDIQFYTKERELEFIERCFKYTLEELEKDRKEVIDSNFENLTSPILSMDDDSARRHAKFFAQQLSA